MNQALVSFALVCPHAGSFLAWLFVQVFLLFWVAIMFSFVCFAPVKRLTGKIIPEMTHSELMRDVNPLLNSCEANKSLALNCNDMKSGRCFADRPFLDLQRTSSDMTVNAGENVELVCNASARPPATIEWTRLGGALLPIGQEKKLVS